MTKGRPCGGSDHHGQCYLKVGYTLDGLGGYHTYGICGNSPVVKAEKLLPMGLAERSQLMRDIPKERFITFDEAVFLAESGTPIRNPEKWLLPTTGFKAEKIIP